MMMTTGDSHHHPDPAEAVAAANRDRRHGADDDAAAEPRKNDTTNGGRPSTSLTAATATVSSSNSSSTKNDARPLFVSSHRYDDRKDGVPWRTMSGEQPQPPPPRPLNRESMAASQPEAAPVLARRKSETAETVAAAAAAATATLTTPLLVQPRKNHHHPTNGGRAILLTKKRNQTNKSSRSRSQRAANQQFQTNLALILSAVTVAGLVVLAVFYGDYYDYDTTTTTTATAKEERGMASSATAAATTTASLQQQQQQYSNRWLAAGDDSDNNQDENDDYNDDYSRYSCSYIYTIAPDAGAAQCAFARHCNQNEGVWAPSVFCSSRFSRQTLALLLAPVMALWLVLLFRLLGSTAEDFFSPALEMLSTKLGLPPRFAGVSLLALGNGAADVSATVSAIAGDPLQGYQLALGALTGAAMLISGVISALVILTADGVPCRGALVRDVAALLVTVACVWWQLGSGAVTPDSVTLFLSIYAGFVVLVLTADVYHRAVVLPRLARRAQDGERQRQLDEAENLELNRTTGNHHPANGGGAAGDDDAQQQQPRGLSVVLTALSNYDNGANDNDDDWGVESDDILARDRPIQLHGHGGLLDRHANHHHAVDAHQRAATAATTTTTNLLLDQYRHSHHEVGTTISDGAAYTALPDEGADGLAAAAATTTTPTPSSSLNWCVQMGSPGRPAASWREALGRDGPDELRRHCAAVWDDIANDPDVNAASKFLLVCELPFTALRKLTVPIPCEGYYCRALIALSLALSPLWWVHYLWDSHGIRVLSSPAAWGCGLLAEAAACAAALGVLRFAPGGDGEMALAVATPIALYGFVIAATWIDTIADALVSLLNFVGILLRIPGPVIGLTILAWGNSTSDLSANITMARKGLANMALTASFAGPVFNILVGLGLGFSRQFAAQGTTETRVSLSPSVITGFVFLIVNAAAILGVGLLQIGSSSRGRIPKQFGYLSLSIYTIYLITSIALQYSKYGG